MANGHLTELREPHWMQDESWLREMRDDDRERYLQGKRRGTKLPSERFWAKVEKHDHDCSCCNGCWIWTGALTDGYGRFCISRGEMVSAHRFAYESVIGPVPEGLTLDHTCHTNDKTCPGGECIHRRCVNPAHLEPVTQCENTRRGSGFAARNAAKTHCVNGHEFTPENTYLRKTGRACKACEATRKAQKHARRRALLRGLAA